MTTIINLPMPPSTNRIWRYSRVTGKAHISERYKVWKRVADKLYLANKRKWKPVRGHFKANVVIDISNRGKTDIDSRVKALLDWLQRVELIENDSLCDGLHIDWGHAPLGISVELLPSSLSTPLPAPPASRKEAA